MKNGIILAGGTGSRLYPLTHVVNKHLLGVNGKFIIDYPVNTLKQMGVENLTVVLGGNHFSQVVDHLQDGKSVGMNINYVYQGAASGIAQAINLCERYVSDPGEDFVVILGDNIYADNIGWVTKYAEYSNGCATVVLNKHSELHRFGVASIQEDQIVKIQEKPQVLPTGCENYAITGCYRFTTEYFEFFKTLKPSPRGEYEITDIIRQYNDNQKLDWVVVNGMWSDAGTHESIAFVNDYFYHRTDSA